VEINHKQFTLGIEIEFTQIPRHIAANVVADYFNSKVEEVEDSGGYDIYWVEDHEGRDWSLVRDGSIEPERLMNGVVHIAADEHQVELVSPILEYDEIPMLQEIIRELRYAGARVNRTTGVHVHIGAEHFNANDLRILCNILYSKQILLYRSLKVKVNRREYATYLPEHLMKRLNEAKPKLLNDFADIWYQNADGTLISGRNVRYNKTRYRMLNLHGLLSGKTNTIEFRLFNGTMHAGKIKSYIQLVTLICANALDKERASPKVTIPENGNEKYAFRVWLLKLGAIGDEFKTLRYHLIKDLRGKASSKQSNDEYELDYDNIF